MNGDYGDGQVKFWERHLVTYTHIARSHILSSLAHWHAHHLYIGGVWPRVLYQAYGGRQGSQVRSSRSSNSSTLVWVSRSGKDMFSFISSLFTLMHSLPPLPHRAPIMWKAENVTHALVHAVTAEKQRPYVIVGMDGRFAMTPALLLPRR